MLEKWWHYSMVITKRMKVRIMYWKKNQILRAIFDLPANQHSQSSPSLFFENSWRLSVSYGDNQQKAHLQRALYQSSAFSLGWIWRCSFDNSLFVIFCLQLLWCGHFGRGTYQNLLVSLAKLCNQVPSLSLEDPNPVENIDW